MVRYRIMAVGGVAAGLVIGVVAALLLGGTALATSLPSESSVRYATNEAGQTYGSARDALSPEEEPDLIAAVAQNGAEGYVLKADLDRSATSPQDAERTTALADSGFVIPVYLSDGRTPVGDFLVGGESVAQPEEQPQAEADH